MHSAHVCAHPRSEGRPAGHLLCLEAAGVGLLLLLWEALRLNRRIAFCSRLVRLSGQASAPCGHAPGMTPPAYQ